MWADQVSETEDAAVSVAAGSAGKDASPKNGEANEGLTEDQRPSDSVIPPQEGYLASYLSRINVRGLTPGALDHSRYELRLTIVVVAISLGSPLEELQPSGAQPLLAVACEGQPMILLLPIL